MRKHREGKKDLQLVLGNRQENCGEELDDFYCLAPPPAKPVKHLSLEATCCLYIKPSNKMPTGLSSHVSSSKLNLSQESLLKAYSTFLGKRNLPEPRHCKPGAYTCVWTYPGRTPHKPESDHSVLKIGSSSFRYFRKLSTMGQEGFCVVASPFFAWTC